MCFSFSLSSNQLACGFHHVSAFLPSPQVMAVPPAPLQLLGVLLTIFLGSIRLTQAGAYYGIKPLPQLPQMQPQIPQYQPLGQQVPHMPLSKDGLTMGKELPHMQYGKEYPHLPQYMKEMQPMPRMGKEAAPKKGKGNNKSWAVTQRQPSSTLSCEFGWGGEQGSEILEIFILEYIINIH